jgi:hypothetical protein
MQTLFPVVPKCTLGVALPLAVLLSATPTQAQVILDEQFTGGASTTGFTITSADTSDCAWIYAPGGLTPNAFNQDFDGALPEGAGFDGDFAFIDSDECGASGIWVNTWLVSPTFDASVSGDLRLEFSHQFRARLESYARVEVFNGTEWSEVAFWTEFDEGYPNPAVDAQIDITQAAGGSAVAQVRFEFQGGWDWWWALDNITITRLDCTAPVAAATVVEDCENDQFNISVNVTSLGDAPSVDIVANGVTEATLNAPGVQVIGPFANQTNVEVTVTHPDALCNLVMDSLTYNCGPCLNTDLFPEDTLAVDWSGAVTPIATNMFTGSEYCAIGGVIGGAQYEVIHEGGAFITVREGTFDGPVVGEGYSPLTFTAQNTGDHFAHFTVDDQCNTDNTGVWAASVQLLGPIGIDETGHLPALRAYPNPAHDQLFVELAPLGSVSMRVMDALGHTVLTLPASRTLNVQALAEGTYVLETLDRAGHPVARARFMKH